MRVDANFSDLIDQNVTQFRRCPTRANTRRSNLRSDNFVERTVEHSVAFIFFALVCFVTKSRVFFFLLGRRDSIFCIEFKLGVVYGNSNKSVRRFEMKMHSKMN